MRADEEALVSPSTERRHKREETPDQEEARRRGGRGARGERKELHGPCGCNLSVAVLSSFTFSVCFVASAQAFLRFVTTRNLTRLYFTSVRFQTLEDALFLFFGGLVTLLGRLVTGLGGMSATQLSMAVVADAIDVIELTLEMSVCLSLTVLLQP